MINSTPQHNTHSSVVTTFLLLRKDVRGVFILFLCACLCVRKLYNKQNSGLFNKLILSNLNLISNQKWKFIKKIFLILKF